MHPARICYRHEESESEVMVAKVIRIGANVVTVLPPSKVWGGLLIRNSLRREFKKKVLKWQTLLYERTNTFSSGGTANELNGGSVG